MTTPQHQPSPLTKITFIARVWQFLHHRSNSNAKQALCDLYKLSTITSSWKDAMFQTAASTVSYRCFPRLAARTVCTYRQASFDFIPKYDSPLSFLIRSSLFRDSLANNIMDISPVVLEIGKATKNNDDSEEEKTITKNTNKLLLVRAEEMEQVTFLDLSRSSVREHESADLTRLLLSSISESAPKLTHLDLTRRTVITPDMLAPLSSKLGHSLQTLHLTECYAITDGCFGDQLSTLSQLRELHVNLCLSLTDAAFEHIGKNYPELQHLEMEDLKKISNDAVSDHVLKLSKLKTLVLRGLTQLTDDAFENIGTRLPLLETLNIGGCYELTDEALTHVSKLPKLKKLWAFQLNLITDDGIAALAQNVTRHSLESLDLYSTDQITNEGAGYLSELRNLRHLNVCCTDLSDSALHKFTNLRKLEYLNVSGCPDMTDGGINHASRQMPKSLRTFLTQ